MTDDLERELRDAMTGAASAAGNDLIDRATNMFGALRPEVRARLLHLIAEPSVEAWDDAHTIIVNAQIGLGRTLWQAVIRVDPNCPHRGQAERSGSGETLTAEQRWLGYFPDPMTTLTAIARAVEEEA